MWPWIWVSLLTYTLLQLQLFSVTLFISSTFTMSRVWTLPNTGALMLNLQLQAS
uniref:Glycosyltransferase n=1 Tax=Rhizophora mucronata TaxID=61149 RepID=A0A2P2JH20_RHIMU